MSPSCSNVMVMGSQPVYRVWAADARTADCIYIVVRKHDGCPNWNTTSRGSSASAIDTTWSSWIASSFRFASACARRPATDPRLRAAERATELGFGAREDSPALAAELAPRAV